MRLSREVFEEYAAITVHRHPVTDWVINRAIRIYGAARPVEGSSGLPATFMECRLLT